MTELMKDSNQEQVRGEISRLKSIRRKLRSDLDKVRLLQLQLYDKAKSEEGYRFYVLYEKIFAPYTLRVAYKRVKANGGSAGIDKQSFGEIESRGLDSFLTDLSESLRKRTYQPRAVKRVWIDKDGGGKRPLGIPTIRDRVAQMACKLVIEPIYEADFTDHSYGFRPKRSAHDAMKQIKGHLETGHYAVYDADLSQYFDTIPHDKLLKTLRLRLSDERVIDLIKKWLKAAVGEEDGTYSGGKKNDLGTPQGGVISPLLSNIYLHLLDKIVSKEEGLFGKSGVKMIRYADDFILMAKKWEGSMLRELRRILDRMELRINPAKSQLVDASEQSFDFLGFTVRLDRSIFGDQKRYWNIHASKKSCKKFRKKLNEALKRIGHYNPEEVVEELNPMIRGWMNYFQIDKVSYVQMQLKEMDHYLNQRLWRYYQRKSQRKSRLHGQQAYQMLIEKYGLIRPYRPSAHKPVNALSRILREKAVCGKTARPV